MPSQDYEEFIAALNAHGVRYLVIGAHAVAFHARPRATKDLDVLLEPTAENARRALAALRDFFGGADLGYTVEDLLDPQWIVQLGVAPVRIDLLSEIPGFASFAAAWRNRVDARFGAVSVHYLGLDDLLRAKEAAGRPQDRADVRVLQRAKGQAQLTKRFSRQAKPET
ncbi:MAG TPA: nucleotidyltransferase [Candidatus Binatia bacterium]|jgi:predicted nucleotidyltransferase|nr:nucleotidyltransferase [Candidatus Binatia bacterium]